MKILQLGKFYPVKGGVERVMYDLTVGLSQRGIKCDMLCATATGRGSHLVHVSPESTIACCRTWLKLKATTIAPSLVNLMRRKCNDYDIVHIHHPDPMASTALYLSGFKGRVVLHWHADILKQQHLLKLYEPLQSWLIRRADVILGTTPVYLQESRFLTHVQHKTRCLPIGIDPIGESPRPVSELREAYSNRRIVFTLGRLVDYKGFTYLIDAARYLPDDVVVLIGGTGPLHDRLQQQIEHYRLEDKVKLIGFIPDEELPYYYHGCDLFCLSSVQKTEAFGIVQIEAMSCGKPVVATTIPGSGTAWVNAHGESGLNVPPADGLALAEAINTILSDSETYARFSRQARERFERIFTRERMIEGCLAVYEELLQDENNPAQRCVSVH